MQPFAGSQILSGIAVPDEWVLVHLSECNDLSESPHGMAIDRQLMLYGAPSDDGCFRGSISRLDLDDAAEALPLCNDKSYPRKYRLICGPERATVLAFDAENLSRLLFIGGRALRISASFDHHSGM